MKTVFTFMLGWLLVAPIQHIHAQENDSSLSEFTPIANSLFWEISGNGLKRPSYLFGTIHLIPKDSFFIPKIMDERMGEADRLMLEIDLGNANMMGALQSAMLPSGTSLKDLLGEEDYAYLKSFIKDSLTPESGGAQISMMIDMLKPIFTAQQLGAAYCGNMPDASAVSGGGDDQQMYEMYLSNIFKESERPVSGLETVDAQMKALDAISLEEQAKQLMEAVRNPESMCGQFGDMVAMYRRQDLQAMMKMTGEDESMGQHLDALLHNRNKSWIPVIEEHIKEECLLIAVGAAHLAGRYGVVNLLREQGYTVKPLKD